MLGELFRGEPEKAGCWASFVAVLWSCVFLAARWCREGRRSRGRTEIRMQFPASIMPVCVSSGCCVTCVVELHAELGEGWPGLVLWTGCFEGCWLLLVVLCPLARVLVG